MKAILINRGALDEVRAVVAKSFTVDETGCIRLDLETARAELLKLTPELANQVVLIENLGD